MKRAFLAIFCGAALLANSIAYAADSASDKEMADRYSQAAQSGDSDAQFYLAALYSAGVGRPRSDAEAFRWFSRAADQGHSHAMLVLSGIYAVGRGVPQDNLNAYKWAYIVSVGTRVEEFRNGSRQLMGVLENRMTREEIDRAKAEVFARSCLVWIGACSACGCGRGWRLSDVSGLLSAPDRNHGSGYPWAGFGGRLWTGNCRARALAQGSAASKAPAGRTLPLRRAGRQSRPNSRPPGRRRRGQRAP